MSWSIWMTLVTTTALLMTVQSYPQYKPPQQACSPCPPGTRVVQVCGVFADTQCEPCPADTFTGTPHQLQKCQVCSQCPPGSYLAVPCSPTADSTCSPCWLTPQQATKDYNLACQNGISKRQAETEAAGDLSVADGHEEESTNSKAEDTTPATELTAGELANDDDNGGEEEILSHDGGTDGAGEEINEDASVEDIDDDGENLEIEEPDYSEIDEATVIVDGGDNNDNEGNINEESSIPSPDQVDNIVTEQPQTEEPAAESSDEKESIGSDVDEELEKASSSIKTDESVTEAPEENIDSEPAVARVMQDPAVNEQEEEGENDNGDAETIELQTDIVNDAAGDGDGDDDNDDDGSDVLPAASTEKREEDDAVETTTSASEQQTSNVASAGEGEESMSAVETEDGKAKEPSTEPVNEQSSSEDKASLGSVTSEKSTVETEDDVDVGVTKKESEEGELVMLENGAKNDINDEGSVGAVRDSGDDSEEENHKPATDVEGDFGDDDAEDGEVFEVEVIPSTTPVTTKGEKILTLEEAEAQYKATHPEEEGSGSDDFFSVTEYPAAGADGVDEGHGADVDDKGHGDGHEHVGPDHVGKLHHGDTEEDIQSKRRTAIIVGVAVGGVAIFTLAFFASRYCRNRGQFKEMKKVPTNGDSEAIEFRPISGSQTGIYEESDGRGSNGLFRQGPKMGPPSPRLHSKGENFAFPDDSAPDKEESKTSTPLLSPNSAQGVSAPVSTQEPLINGVERQLKYIDDSTDDEYVASVRERFRPSRSPDPKLNNVAEETAPHSPSIKRNSSSASGSQPSQSRNGGLSVSGRNIRNIVPSAQRPGSGSFDRSTSGDNTKR